MLRLTKKILELPIEKYFAKQSGPAIVRAIEPFLPNVHLPMEMWMFKNAANPVCFIRTNPRSIVIGSGQLAQAECNLKKMKEDNIPLIRRKSGGGAVYLDEGNCMVGIFGNRGDVTKEICQKIMCDAISETFSVNAYITGKNDIKVEGLKVAGLAYQQNKDNFLAHACILVDADLTQLSKYLTPHQKKIESHGIKSVDQRVMNLCKFNGGKRKIDLEKSLEQKFNEIWPVSRENNYYITGPEMLKIEDVNENHKLLTDPEYLYGKNIHYNMRINHKFKWGFVDLFLTIKNKTITNIEVSTDCLDVNFKSELIKCLTNWDVKINDEYNDTSGLRYFCNGMNPDDKYYSENLLEVLKLVSEHIINNDLQLFDVAL